jgi:hypothetical protein
LDLELRAKGSGVADHVALSFVVPGNVKRRERSPFDPEWRRSSGTVLDERHIVGWWIVFLLEEFRGDPDAACVAPDRDEVLVAGAEVRALVWLFALGTEAAQSCGVQPTALVAGEALHAPE